MLLRLSIVLKKKNKVSNWGRCNAGRVCAALLLVCAGAFVSAQNAARESFDRARMLQDRQDWYGAAESYQEALQYNPDYGEAWLGLAQCTYETGEYSLTLTYLDSAAQYAKDNTTILNLRGFALIGLGRTDEADAVFREVLAMYPNDVDARFGLAELDIFYGRISGAEQLYQDALKRQTTNRRALLSLALVSEELGKLDAARIYIDQALRYHSGEAEVHYLAAYLSAKEGNLSEAERRARAAVQLDGNNDEAYELLANILFTSGRYQDVIDICDFRINRDRSAASAWYLKGLCLEMQGDYEGAMSAYSGGLDIDPQDEIMRTSLEQLVLERLPVEDERRAELAAYHVEKARSYANRFMSPFARYEYQLALRLDPSNTEARSAYADMLLRDGFPEQYLSQLKFISGRGKVPTAIADTIEAYDALTSDSLGVRWNVNPFYLDKTRWQLSFYYEKSPVQLLHADADRLMVQSAEAVFASVPTVRSVGDIKPVSGFADAFRRARESGSDYFALLAYEENGRDVSINCRLYSGRTGTLATTINIFRTGNDRYASALIKLRDSILEVMPPRGTILKRDGNIALADIGRADAVTVNSVYTIVKKDKVLTSDQGTGLRFDQSDVLGTLSISEVGEEISEGVIQQSGFYDRINVGDELVLVPAQTAGSTDAAAANTDTAAANAGGAAGTAAAAETVSAETSGAERFVPVLADLIRSIR